MKKRILCIWHKEDTPSLLVNANGYGFCFGCSKHGWVDPEKAGLAPLTDECYQEPIDETLEYISRLPKASMRGLFFPFDEAGYYVVWPDRNYYKKRLSGVESGSKYRSPVGHEKPLFSLETRGDRLLIVEGEINAMSIHKAMPDIAVCSPGSSGDFYSPNKLKYYLPHYRKYAKLDIIADDDPAGFQAATGLMGALGCYLGHEPKMHFMKPDANDILVSHGWERLRHDVETLLGMSTRM